MSTCPCCSTTVLRHVRHGTIYWFCPHCWQEVPDLEPKMGITSRQPSVMPYIKTLATAARH
jgi:ribosomal protein L37AE/L43A